MSHRDRQISFSTNNSRVSLGQKLRSPRASLNQREMLVRPSNYIANKQVPVNQTESVSGKSVSISTASRRSTSEASTEGSLASMWKRLSIDSQSSCSRKKRCDCDANLFIKKFRDELEIVFQSKHVRIFYLKALSCVRLPAVAAHMVVQMAAGTFVLCMLPGQGFLPGFYNPVPAEGKQKAASTDKSEDDEVLCDSMFPSVATSRRVSFFNDDQDLLDDFEDVDQDQSLPDIGAPGTSKDPKYSDLRSPRDSIDLRDSREIRSSNLRGHRHTRTLKSFGIISPRASIDSRGSRALKSFGIRSPRASSSHLDRSPSRMKQSKIKESLKSLKRNEAERIRNERMLMEKKLRLDKNKKELEKQLRRAEGDDTIDTAEMQKNLAEIQQAYKMVEKSKAEMEDYKRQDELARMKFLQQQKFLEEREELMNRKRQRALLKKSSTPTPTLSSSKPKPSSTLPSFHEKVSQFSNKIYMNIKDIASDSERRIDGPSKLNLKTDPDLLLPAIQRSPSARSGYYLEDESYEEEEFQEDDSCCKCPSTIQALLKHEPEVTDEEDGQPFGGKFEQYYTSLYNADENVDLSTPMNQAKYYLQQRNIDDLFRFLGSHLTAAQPENPIQFLINLLEQCIEYRDHYRAPPLLFQFKHLESLFKDLDPMGFGEISLDQYVIGLHTLGIKKNYGDPIPKLNERFMISKDAFIAEAYSLLKIELNKMIQIPGEPVKPTLDMALWTRNSERSG